MDELMVNSEAVHKGIIEKVLNTYGASLYDPKDPFTKEQEAGWFGLTLLDIFKYFHKRFHLENKTTPEEMNNLFNELLFPIYEKEVPEMPGVRDIITYVKGKYKLAIASSAKRTKIDMVIHKLDAKDVFDVIVSGEDEVKLGKPAPDIYLKAAELLHVAPQACLVLEDAKNGVEAAKAAGMYCIGVHNKLTFEKIGKKQDLSKADVEVDSLFEALAVFKQSQS